ncbi:MAG: hypothetical protein CFE23_02605 [Flavobacterium sp. BFFFF1]|uniref:hypothetical protein n=1 Tax=Flavobacterium sp. BFFFF1 TaxID=2015557 RepID=UPI000BCE975B|nr:hypothetical protein [Flavobacterium sp. BFFFF1]OYU81790.1 MAG: hypothetical protein CFE23_02605 [Flavobacterium sp. BFFFF1]
MKKPILVLFLLFIFCSKAKTVLDYTQLKHQITDKRNDFRKLYIAGSNSVKDSVIIASRDYVFESTTNDLFDQWYDTPWSFYGHTTAPKKGTIACGYFVTAILSDAGFKIPRNEWAKLASKAFIVKLTDDVNRSQYKPIEDVITYLKRRGDGLYVVGLDCHTGFVYVKGSAIKFVHSNYYQPKIGVMAQEPDGKNPLADSKYRILGKLLNDRMTEK